MQLPHVEEDIEAPSLSGTTLEDSILSSSSAESSPPGAEFQPTLKDRQGKSPTNHSNVHTMEIDALTPSIHSATKQRSAREVKEASRLREMVRVVGSLLVEDG